ncbi:hypothetical protein XENOCAPTIV_006137 [Xenoophorus captivus]|uniref:Uncharacterized protein n=1 Tax=Xenoophorus captivus TaxID=1517983 RepID=A0ABV0RH56_9TELE
MALSTVLETPGAGFNFDNAARMELSWEPTQEPRPVTWWPTRCLALSTCLLLSLISSSLSQLEKAKELVRAAIHAGIMSDLGSGNNIDICVITKEGVDYIRPYQESEYKDDR